MRRSCWRDAIWLRRLCVGLDVINSAAHDHGPAHTKRLEHACQRFAELGHGHTNKLGGWASWIQERAKKIEDGPLSAGGAQFSSGGHMLERGMIGGCEEKCEPMV